MSRAKINDTKMLSMVSQGLNQVEIAEAFFVSKQAVNKRLRQLKVKTTREIQAHKVEQAVNDRLDSVQQLKMINEEALNLLKKLENNPAMMIKTMAEIRNQLRLQLDIFSTLYDLNAAREFQEEVLSAIEEASPDVRDRIIQKLSEKKALYAAVQYDR